MSKMDGGLDVVKGHWGVGVRFKDGIIEEEACRIKKIVQLEQIGFIPLKGDE